MAPRTLDVTRPLFRAWDYYSKKYFFYWKIPFGVIYDFGAKLAAMIAGLRCCHKTHFFGSTTLLVMSH
jgi:hypothetical protein